MKPINHVICFPTEEKKDHKVHFRTANYSSKSIWVWAHGIINKKRRYVLEILVHYVGLFTPRRAAEGNSKLGNAYY